MKRLLEKLANLADQLDEIDAPEIADEVDGLMRGLPLSVMEPSVMEEVERLSKKQDANMNICPLCEGEGMTDTSPWCEGCDGTGFVE